MSKEDFVMAVWKGKGKGKGKGNRMETRAPPKDLADTTCPNCNKKGHRKEDCTEPKVELKDRKCFICGAPGCVAKTCPKRKLMAKALVAPGAEEPGSAWFGCVASSCCAPAHRSKNQRRMVAWEKATAAAERAPKGFTLGDAMGSVFTKLASLEARTSGGDGRDASDKEHEEELKTEGNGHGDPASVVPLVSILVMAAAETPLEPTGTGEKLAALMEDTEEDFEK